MGFLENLPKRQTLLIAAAFLLLFLIFVLALLLYTPFLKQNSTGKNGKSEEALVQDTGFNISLELQSRTQGFKILYQGQENDISGRSILVDTPQILPGGWNDLNTNGKVPIVFREEDKPSNILDYYVVSGIIKEIRPIPGSPDYSVVIQNPLTDLSLEFRAHKDITELQENLFVVTSVNVFDLSEPEEEAVFLGDFNSFSTSQIEKMIQPGDTVLITTVPLYREDAERLGYGAWTDPTGVYAASWITLRRFGGAEQVRKETSGE